MGNAFPPHVQEHCNQQSTKIHWRPRQCDHVEPDEVERLGERGCLCLVSLYLDWILTYLPKNGNYVLLLFFDAPLCWQKIFGYSFYNIFRVTPTWLFRLLRHKEVDLSSSWIHEGIPDESFQTWGNRNKLHLTYLSVLHKASQASKRSPKNAHDTTVTLLFTSGK